MFVVVGHAFVICPVLARHTEPILTHTDHTHEHKRTPTAIRACCCRPAWNRKREVGQRRTEKNTNLHATT